MTICFHNNKYHFTHHKPFMERSISASFDTIKFKSTSDVEIMLMKTEDGNESIVFETSQSPIMLISTDNVLIILSVGVSGTATAPSVPYSGYGNRLIYTDSCVSIESVRKATLVQVPELYGCSGFLEQSASRRWTVSNGIKGNSISRIEHMSTGTLTILSPEIVDQIELHLETTSSGSIQFVNKMNMFRLICCMGGVGSISLGGSDIEQVGITVSGMGQIDSFRISKLANLELYGMGRIICEKARTAKITEAHVGMGTIQITSV